MYKSVIFDLDGTLLDTSRDIHKVLNNSLSHFGLPEISIEKTLEYVGNGAKLLVQRALPKGKGHLLNDVYKHFSINFAKCDNSLTCLYDGEDAVLKFLKDNGVKIGIVTNKPQDAAVGVVEKHLKKYCFDGVIGQTEKFPLKPDPSSVLYMLESFGVKKEECLFVGDGETDVITAINAGVDGVSVLWGFRNKAQLVEAGAKLFATDYAQLKNIIESKTV